MREKQQAVVQAFGNTSRDSNSIDVDKYLAESLKVHMIEAVGSRQLTDKQCGEWLDVNEDALHIFSVAAAEVIGRGRLLQMGKTLEAEDKKYLAARRFIAAANTTEDWSAHSFDSKNTAESITYATVQQWGVDLLEQAVQTGN